MAKAPRKFVGVETLKHDEKRKNITTAEYQFMLADEEKKPIQLAYERRNRDLDPQLVWRGKDEQDWSGLVVHAPPLYIQEKIHPKFLIDDLLRESRARRQKDPGGTIDLFADFNGIPKGVDKTEFYAHDQKWSNRMILASHSNIEWTEMTWNPVTGCVKVSQGCKHCYAERMAKRLKAMGSGRYVDGFKPTLHTDMIDLPRRWRAPRTIFINSMSDLFQEAVPLDFICRVFDTMVACPQHTFQILTKRSARLLELSANLPLPENVWMGVSVESSQVVSRVDDLRQVPAAVRFLSCEPLISSLGNLNLSGMHWVIVGGESGPGARPMREGWAQEIRVRCEEQNVPFFFKQWGGVRKERFGREMNGRTYDNMPTRRVISLVPVKVAA